MGQLVDGRWRGDVDAARADAYVGIMIADTFGQNSARQLEAAPEARPRGPRHRRPRRGVGPDPLRYRA